MKISRFKTREKTGGINEAKRKDLIFYVSLMALPVAQFLIFYIGVNARSVLYAFQNIDLTKNSVTFTFDNFKNIFNAMRTTTLYSSLTKISLISYAVSLVVGVPLGLFFSFYIAEKMPFANGFRVALFLPSIISAITMVTIYRFFVEIALTDIVNDFFHIKIKGLLENPATRFSAIMFYNVFIGFGTSVLMYSNSMSGISEEVIEAAKLDGATGIKKFFYVVFPQVFGTVSTFLIIGVAGIFTNQINLFSFYEASAPDDVRTLGYYLYVRAQLAVNEAEFPELSALGLLLTAIAVPLTMLVKRLLEKFGYSED